MNSVTLSKLRKIMFGMVVAGTMSVMLPGCSSTEEDTSSNGGGGGGLSEQCKAQCPNDVDCYENCLKDNTP